MLFKVELKAYTYFHFGGNKRMESTQEEKGIRLNTMLQEALTPMIEKINDLEKEIKTIKDSVDEVKKLLSEKDVK